MKKVLMVATVASMIGSFNLDNLSILQKMGYEVHGNSSALRLAKERN